MKTTDVKKYTLLYILSLLVSLFVLPSCSEEDDTIEEYPDWQAVNEARWETICAEAQMRIAAGDTSWKILRKWSLEDSLQTANTNFIVAHVEETGSGTTSPLYTDSVRIYYEGRLLPSVSYSVGYVFDSHMPPTYAPVQFYLGGGLVDGFTTALLNMHVGDRWTVYMPHQLGYGISGSSSIPAYSLLTFDITLASFFRPGTGAPEIK